MAEPQRFRKKPVEIEAVQLTNDPHEAARIAAWCGGVALASPGRVSLHIETLEGTMVAHPSDWIIREPFPTEDRKFYPCKPDIFAATYEAVDRG